MSVGHSFIFFFTSSIAALFQVVNKLHGYVSGAKTRFWCTAEAGGRRGEPRIDIVVACPFDCFLKKLLSAEGICFDVCGAKMCNQRALFEEVPTPIVGLEVDSKALKCC